MRLKDFIGQGRLIKQIIAVATTSKRWNIFLRGVFGSGKTTLALLVAQILSLYTYQIPIDGRVQLPALAKVHIIDECHLLHQFEPLYPEMEDTNFIFCTNLDSQVPEAFLSRCFDFRMAPYTLEEMGRIIGLHANLNQSPLPQEVCKFIARRSKLNPRTGVMLMRKYVALNRLENLRNTVETARKQFALMGVGADGLDAMDRQYLGALSSGPKSARSLQAILNLDAESLRRVERFLLRQQLMTITSRGRILCQV